MDAASRGGPDECTTRVVLECMFPASIPRGIGRGAIIGYCDEFHIFKRASKGENAHILSCLRILRSLLNYNDRVSVKRTQEGSGRIQIFLTYYEQNIKSFSMADEVQGVQALVQ